MSNDKSPELSPKEASALAAFFDEARVHQSGHQTGDETEPSDELMARVLTDAKDAQAAFMAPVKAKRAPNDGFWHRLLGSGLLKEFGGPGGAVLAGSALLGLGLGFFGADTLSLLSEGVIDGVNVEILDEGLGDLSAELSFMEG